MKKWQEKIIDIAEELDWRVSVESNCFEFEKYSPAGEDFIFSIIATSLRKFQENLKEFHETFDREDHVFELLEAKRRGFAGVPDLDTLVEDSKDIENMLKELAEKVAKIKQRKVD